MKDLNHLVRPHLQALAQQAASRAEEAGDERTQVALDRNESPHNAPLNRYPDPRQAELRAALARAKGVSPECVFAGCGSSEAIDLVFRVFCQPGKDNVASVSPTCRLYASRAALNDVEYRSVPLGPRFRFKAADLLDACDSRTKVLFLCSPNTPDGRLLDREEIVKALESFDGMVVIDEAYGDFSGAKSFRFELARFRNLIVLQTLSAAWASAGIRLGMAFAAPAVIGYLDRMRLPYNVGTPARDCALEILKRRYDVEKWARRTVEERERVTAAFRLLPACVEVYPSDSNFFLARMKEADKICRYLREKGIAVSYCGDRERCEGCLRVSIGSPQENSALLGALRQYV